MAEIESEVLPGSGVCEDLVWVGETEALVLDGATGLGDLTVSDAPSDGRWYVEALSEELRERLDGSDERLTEVTRDAIEAVATRYEALVGDAEPASHERPSAAGALIRWDETDGRIDYLVLGDCSVVFETADGAEAVVGEGPRRLDERVVEEMVAIRADTDESLTLRELRERVRPMLVEHRKLKNTEGGYWAFGLTPRAVEEADTGSFDLGATESTFLFTDGFEPICTTYDAFEDWGTLAAYLGTDGLDRALRILRTFETADPECEVYPRLKPSDDVGLVRVEWGARR